MKTNLIYLHIEKSAGTAQRTLFWANYGRENVAWSGLDSSGHIPRDILRFSQRPVLGGHLDFDVFNSLRRRCLFTAVVRRPLDRAISLFYYLAHNAHDEQRKGWRKRGLDPENMTRTIERCQKFRDELKNAQCWRLGGGGSFDGVLQRLETSNFVIGDYEVVNEFNRKLGELLSWHTVNMGTYNVAGRPGYQDEIRREPELAERIAELTEEDERLYAFVQKSNGVYHVPDERLFRATLSANALRRQPTATLIENVVLSLVKGSEIEWNNDSGRLEVRITNRSTATLAASGPSRFMLGYHWLGEKGGIIEEGLRIPLPHNLASDESVVVSARIRPPSDRVVSGRKVRLSMIAVGRHWLASVNHDHGLVIAF